MNSLLAWKAEMFEVSAMDLANGLGLVWLIHDGLLYIVSVVFDTNGQSRCPGFNDSVNTTTSKPEKAI